MPTINLRELWMCLGFSSYGEVILNVASDRAYGPSELGVRQAIGFLALRAAENHRPALRASL